MRSKSLSKIMISKNSVTTDQRNGTLVNATYKVQQVLFPPHVNEVLVERDCSYNLRRCNFLNRRRINSVRHGTVYYLAPKIWDILPKEIKNFETLSTLKAKIKKWVPWECLFRLLVHTFS